MKTQSFSPIKKTDPYRQIIYTEVYTPMVPDSQGDFMTADEIESACHNFMKRQRLYNIDTEHSLQKNESCVVECFIARSGDQLFVPGSWVVGLHVPDPKTWDGVMKGDINAVSMYGSGIRKDAVIEIDIPEDGIVKGETHDSVDHKHQFFIKFDSQGNYQGYTDEVNGHKHVIKAGTVTEHADGHAHRYSMSDALSALIGAH
jgi:hypothetical protein